MIQLLVFTLICYGISNIVVHSTIFEGLRNSLEKHTTIHDLVTCMMCFPFWVGIFGSSVYSPSHEILEVTNPFLYTFLDGVYASATVWLIHTLQEHYERE